uniref:Cytochrome b561 domain-containing protein n=1 Tax=Chrysotila carterae TaxID=13221 RepID=A0A6S9Z6J7_CHRCT
MLEVDQKHEYEAMQPPVQSSSSKLAMAVGGIGTHVLAFVIFLMMYFVLSDFNGGTAPLEWGSFLLHPLLMTLAFGFFSPIGTVVYGSYERLFRMDHASAKVVHMAVQGVALLTAILGVSTMWIKHDALAAAGILGGPTQPPAHFQTGHSWVGMAVVVIFGLQWLGGLVTFMLPNVVSLKVQFHMHVSSFSLVSVVCDQSLHSASYEDA